jgi:hypothetical protein
MGAVAQSKSAYSTMRQENLRKPKLRNPPGPQGHSDLDNDTKSRSQRPPRVGIKQRQDDEYLSQLQILTNQKDLNPTMKMPNSTKRIPVFSRVKARSLEERNIRLLIDDQRRLQRAKLSKRDAIIEIQALFFNALRHLYTWPLDRLTFASIDKVRAYWTKHLTEAQRLAYRAETIDPNHFGHLRYDIMIEIVKLENYRINDFLAHFDHIRNLIKSDDASMDDETLLDDTILANFDWIQTNVILDVTPQWIEEARRPPLTWYGFIEPVRPSYPEERLLAPEYYDSPTAM